MDQGAGRVACHRLGQTDELPLAGAAPRHRVRGQVRNLHGPPLGAPEMPVIPREASCVVDSFRSRRSRTRTASGKRLESVGGWIVTGTTVASMRTVFADSTVRAARLVTSRLFSSVSVCGNTRRSVGASADFDGAGTTALTRQKARYVRESARWNASPVESVAARLTAGVFAPPRGRDVPCGHSRGSKP